MNRYTTEATALLMSHYTKRWTGTKRRWQNYWRAITQRDEQVRNRGDSTTDEPLHKEMNRYKTEVPTLITKRQLHEVMHQHKTETWSDELKTTPLKEKTEHEKAWNSDRTASIGTKNRMQWWRNQHELFGTVCPIITETKRGKKRQMERKIINTKTG